MLGPESPEEFLFGPLRVTIEYRRTADDEGPSLRVFGQVGNGERQVLRFDCFVEDPHYHYDPDGRDEVHHMRDEGIDDVLEWTLHRLERSVADMIRRAGFGPLADRVDERWSADNVHLIQEALAVLAV